MPKTKKRQRYNQNENGTDIDKDCTCIEVGAKKPRTGIRRGSNKGQIAQIESDITQLVGATPALYKEEQIADFDTDLEYFKTEQYNRYLVSIENFNPMFINLYNIIESYINMILPLASPENKKKLSDNLTKLDETIKLISSYTNICAETFKKIFENDTMNIISMIDKSNVIMYVCELFFKETINIIENYNNLYPTIDSNGKGATGLIQAMKLDVLNCIQGLRNELKYWRNNLKNSSEYEISSSMNNDNNTFNDSFKELSKRLFLKRFDLISKENITYYASLDILDISLQECFNKIDQISSLFGDVQIADKNIEIQLVAINNEKDYLAKQFEDLKHNAEYLVISKIHHHLAWLYKNILTLPHDEFVKLSYVVNYKDQYIKFITLFDKLKTKIQSIENQINMNNQKDNEIPFEQIFDLADLNVIINSPITNKQPTIDTAQTVLNEEVAIKITSPSENITINVTRQWLPLRSTPERNGEGVILQNTENSAKKAKRTLTFNF